MKCLKTETEKAYFINQYATGIEFSELAEIFVINVKYCAKKIL